MASAYSIVELVKNIIFLIILSVPLVNSLARTGTALEPKLNLASYTVPRGVEGPSGGGGGRLREMNASEWHCSWADWKMKHQIDFFVQSVCV